MRNYKNYADMITFSRASSGTALAKIGYGSNLTTSSTVITPLENSWTDNGDGTFTITPDGSGYLDFALISQVEIGSAYEIKVEILAGSGTGLLWGPYWEGVRLSAFDFAIAGTFTFIVEAISPTNQTIRFLDRGGTGSTTIRVTTRKVTYNDPTGTIQLISHPTNQPRVEYDYQGNRLGLLIEEARTNYNPDSDSFLAWLKTNTTENNGLVTATATNNIHRISRVFSGFSGAVVSWADMKFGTHRYIQIYDGSSTQNFATFDLVEGTVTNTGGNTTGFISQIGDGVYRCAAAYGTAHQANGNSFIGFGNSANSGWGDNSFDADGTETVYVYRHQLEAGTFPTSYIPTSGATATRSADVATIGVGAFGYNQKAGTALIEMDTVSSSFHALNVNTDATNRFAIYGSTSTLYLYVRNSFGTYNNSLGVLSNNSLKAAATLKEDRGYSGSRDATTNFSIDVPNFIVPPVTKINIGSNESGGQQMTGHIKNITYYPRRLTEAQIQKLTQVKAVPTLSLTFDGNSDSYLETSTHG